MLQTSSRPPSVLIMQVILVMIGGLWLVGGLFYLFAAITTQAPPAQTVVFALLGSLTLALSISFLIGFWGLAKRKSYGRWIGVIGVSLILISVFLGNMFSPGGPLAGYEYKNSLEVAGAVTAATIFYGLIMLLIYRLARGKRANEFFSADVASAMEEPTA